jgi:branched-chain amino acid transport system substrate-binding protein
LGVKPHLLSSALLAAVLMAGCQKSDSSLKVGLAGVQSGPDGQIGSTMIYGSQIAIDEWNEKGGLLGRKIEAVVRDDEGKPNQAVAVAHEIVSQGAVAVIGHFNSGCSIPSSEIYSQGKLVQITPGSTNPQVTERGIGTLFRIVGRDDQQGVVGATYAKEKLNIQKIAILHNKTAYGQGLAEEVRKTFEGLGGKVVYFSGISEEEMDFRANISALQGLGAEAVFWGGMYGQAAPLFTQIRDAGLQVPFISGDGTIVKEFLDTVGPNAAGIYLTFGPDFKQAPTAQEFLKKYRAKYGEEGPYSVYGYDAANVLFTAIQEAGVTDAEAVAKVLHSRAFDTCLGKVEFNEKGDLKQTNYVIWTVKDGAYTVLE